jgi:hypothetical protein
MPSGYRAQYDFCLSYTASVWAFARALYEVLTKQDRFISMIIVVVKPS